jgi:hypothetical protein
MVAGVGLFLLASDLALSGYKEDIGYTRLSSEIGVSLPTGNGISVSHVEAPAGADYMPDTNLIEFAGKTFTNVSALSTGVSSHATTVGQYFYGTSSSIAGGISVIDNYEGNNWIADGFLKTGSTNEPAVEIRDIQNHSWVGDSSAATNLIRRLDYAINRDGFTAVVGLNNSTGTLPQLLAYSYNAISVGRTDGLHTYGTTSFDMPGRTKPELVAPLDTVSVCVPVVSAAAALLLEKAKGNSALSNAVNPECIKAILLAGATKDEFPGWSRTPSRPLDTIYGAGELNVYNSYHVLVAGEQTPSASNPVERLGWDYGSLAAATNAFHFFDVPISNVMTRFSAVLTWNRQITDALGPGFNPIPSISNMDLFLYQSADFVPSNLVDLSTSQVDNVEHIYSRDLRAGQYALKVSTDAAVNYALAWFSRTAKIPEIRSVEIISNSIAIASEVTSNIAYAVQASTNLLDVGGWSPVSTNTSSSNIMIYVDSDSTNYFRRFYRLIPDP